MVPCTRRLCNLIISFTINLFMTWKTLIAVKLIGAFKVLLNQINFRSRNTTRMHNRAQKFVHNIYIYQRNSAHMYPLSRPLPFASAKSRNGVSTFVGIVSLFCKPSRARIVSNGLLDFTERRRAKMQVTGMGTPVFVCLQSRKTRHSLSLSIIVSRSSLRLFGTPLKSQMPHSILHPHARCRS